MGKRKLENNKAVEYLQKKPAPDEFLIVGIGASAGGINALQEFFRNVPPASGMSYVVILHLSPDHDSMLAEVLQRETTIPVNQVTKKTTIRPDHIYVVPPNQHLTIEGGHIVVSANIEVGDRRAPVDIFFRTLADEHGPRSVAVILSGTGANGSMGIKRIKERGGVCFVQNPREAEYNEMPRNSIATEMVDEVLPVADIPAKIISYRASLNTVEITEDTEKRTEEQQQALREVFTQLRIQTGHDFTNYKKPTLLRRIERRINLRNLPHLPAYARFLKENADEPAALLKDLLISVTNFFRDKKAFDVIEQEIIPAIFKDKTSEDQVRIWVAGCATGEEAYSFAMLCAERVGGIIDAPRIQIFATDIDESAIVQAREGIYTLNDAADVSPERLRRFFKKEGDDYRISREVREMIMFANHNFLKDPPFSHLDLVSCRNVLIYLNQVAQERVMGTFHFALNPRGYLFVGSSESVDSVSGMYTIYNREHHIFQTRPVRASSYPIPDSTSGLYFDKLKKDNSNNEKEKKILERISFGDLHQQLLEEYAPPSVVINEEYDILHLTEKAGRYLQVSGGELSQNLLKLVRPELRLELRSALYQAVQRQTAVEARGLKLNTGDKTETINIHVRPVLRSGDVAKGFILVIFETTTEEGTQEIIVSSDEPMAKQLEEELIRVKSHLRASIEHHDFQAEEMKASNEELQAMNEELRSSAEELETSKEELQSINEELRTVNQELKVKVEETTITSNNLRNLINSTDIGTIFLDRSLRVALYTPAATAIFNLIPADFGRPLSDITTRLEYENLLKDAELVLEKLTPLEKEVRTKDDKLFLMHITPYRTDEENIKGVVITFLDITANKNAERAVRHANEQMRLIIESAKDHAIFTFDLERNVTTWNVGAQEVFGFTEEEILGKSGDILFVPEDRATFAPEHEAKTAYRKGHAENERWHLRKDGSRFYGSGMVTPMLDDGGTVIGFVKIMRDLTKEKLAQLRLKESEERQAYLLKLSDVLRPLTDPVLIQQAATRITMDFFGANRCYYCEIEGDNAIICQDAATKGLASMAGTHPLKSFTLFNAAIRSKKPFIINDVNTSEMVDEALRALCTQLQITSFIQIPFIKQGKVAGIFSIVQSGQREWKESEVELLAETAERTWTAMEKAKVEEKLAHFAERYRIALDSAQMGTWDWDVQHDLITCNEQFYNLVGLKPDHHKPILREDLLKLVYPEHKQKVAAALQAAAETGGAFNADFRIVAPGNIKKWVFGYGTSVKKEKDRSVRMAGVLFDITQRKKLEQQKEEFLTIASHELKTPVTSIKAYGELVQAVFETGKDQENAELVQKMNAQINRLNTLIYDLLDTTRIAEGELILNYSDFDLLELINNLVNEMQDFSHKHSLVVKAPGSMPIYADRARIEQVITNLISNAIKYSPDGGQVTITCELLETDVKISVADTGIGIDEKLQEKVFDRFFRVRHQATNSFPGMGLGLYITAGIIKRHGGTIGVKRNDDKGTIFYFTLQRKQ
jgi:PAS domain S-box-containing protein